MCDWCVQLIAYLQSHCGCLCYACVTHTHTNTHSAINYDDDSYHGPKNSSISRSGPCLRYDLVCGLVCNLVRWSGLVSVLVTPLVTGRYRILPRLEHIANTFFLPIILFRNSSYFNLLFPYYHPIILTNLVESMHKIASIREVSM